MGRFSGEPLKSPLVGNEFIPLTDPATGNDGSCNPSVLTQFVMVNGYVANGSSNGLIDAAAYAKLTALDTQTQTNAWKAQLAEVTMPIFFSSPANTSTVNIYQHIAGGTDWDLGTGSFLLSAGSTNITLYKNGGAIAGLTNIAVGTSAYSYGIAPPINFTTGDLLGISMAGTTGSAANLAISLLFTAQLSA
jgi:hypothetical protein